MRNVLFAMLAFTLMLGAGVARAQEYVLGPQDVIQVSVWMHPELEKTLTLNSEGSITYPPLGDIKAGGLTPSQLATRLGDRLSTYLRQTSTVTVTVSQPMSHAVDVQGAVAKPGRYGFEKIPGLVDVLSAAGGAVPGADLANVQIIRREGPQRRTLRADVAAVLRDGDTSKLPALQAGDMIVVPAGVAGGTGAVSGGAGAAVIGQVNHPGLYGISEGTDLWVVLAQAGGTTDRADLAGVRILTGATQGRVSVNKVDLKDVLNRGARAPVLVKPGDVVYVGSTAGSGLAKTWSGITAVLGVTQYLLNVAVLADVLKR
jgi:polysaccharide export outer membrane protein